MDKKGHLDINTVKKVHFIGIGGISMSGLAEILLQEGYAISGSDMKASPTTLKLMESGMTISTPHHKDNIKDPQLVVYTAAIKGDNPELLKAQELGIPTIDRASLLGELMDGYHCSIACSGTHGKTTTTSMITSIMMEAGTDPTAHIGGILPMINDSTRVGSNQYFVTEACEYVESFLKFNPKIAVILNIEADHLDYFRDLDHVKEAFLKFAKKVPQDGFIVANADDENVTALFPSIPAKVVTYGLKNPSAQWQAKDISFNEFGCGSFTVLKDQLEYMHLTLNVPGIHNVSNALSAIAACHCAYPALDTQSIARALGGFKGANRRFELKGFVDGIKVVDDYAHHPTEIKATLSAAREGNYKKILCIFQPHTYSRTKALLQDFSNAFDKADTVVISDIYAAREADPGDVHARDLTQKLQENGRNAIYLDSFEEIVEHVAALAQPGDFVITMGAGNIDKVAEMFITYKFEKALI